VQAIKNMHPEKWFVLSIYLKKSCQSFSIPLYAAGGMTGKDWHVSADENRYAFAGFAPRAVG